MRDRDSMSLACMNPIRLVLLLCMIARCGVHAASADLSLPMAGKGLPDDPARGGKAGGPIEMLLLRGHAEMNFGEQPPLDERYRQKLVERGYRLTEASEQEVLTREFLNRFNVVVYLNPSPLYGGGYFDSSRWRGGPALLTVRTNALVLKQYVEEGGGLLFVPALEEIGTRTIESLRQLFAPYGLDTACAVPRDPARLWEAARIMKRIPICYGWTESFAPHPVTEGVHRIYYPSYCTRWDDNYTTIPLFPRDPAWVRLADTAPEAESVCRRGTIYDPKAPEIALPGLNHPALIVARAFGKGRVAVSGIGPFHLFYLTYSEKGVFAEANFVRIDGIAMEKGDGTTPSDLHRLLDHLYRWLAETATLAGLGGGVADGLRPAPNPFGTNDVTLADCDARHDPMITGAVRPHKILVGAHSGVSDGQGTPSEWAQAARRAGYDVICFTEAFEHLKRDAWDDYVRACAEASSPEVVVLPGLDFDTDLGNRFLVVGHLSRIRDHLLTPDGRKLMWTGHLLIGMGDSLAVAARPERMARARAEGALTPELYSHVAGVAVATYNAAGQAVDDGLAAYKVLVDNGTHPYPLAIHELTAPAQLEQALSGLQNYVDADTAEHAAFLFRQCHARSGANPDRAYVSSGPWVDAYRIDDWKSPCWAIQLMMHGAHAITNVTVLDQRGIFRQFRPGTAAVDLTWHGDAGAQEWFTVLADDDAGGRAILPALRTLTPYHVVRCLDRQNFFAVGLPVMEVSYTGRERSATRGPLKVEVPGVPLAAPFCPKYRFPLFSADLIVHDNAYETTLVPGGRVPEADNDPLFNELPIPEFSAVRRFFSFMSPRKVMDGRLHEVTVTLRSNLVAVGQAWPVVMKVKPGSKCGVPDAAGSIRVVALPRTNGIALPAGTVIGDSVLVSPLWADASGTIGFPARSGAVACAGTTFHAEAFTLPAKDTRIVSNASEVVSALGLVAGSPAPVVLDQGHVVRHAVVLEAEAADHGVAGRILVTNAIVLHKLPLVVRGIHSRWPLGVWRPGEPIQPGAALDGVGRLALECAAGGAFYAGNLLMADHDEVYLAFTGTWEAGAEPDFEVTNPTDHPMTVTVRSPAALRDRAAVHVTLEVPAGQVVIHRGGGHSRNRGDGP